MSEKRDQWGSRLGFILASIGSAVGLGNVWRFSYLAGENGGGAFIIIYILCAILIGFPLMMSEFMIGRKSQSDAVNSFHKLSPGRPWYFTGIIGVIACFFILSFYSVIAGWTIKYIFSYLTGGLWNMPDVGFDGYFNEFISSPIEPVLWQALFMILTIWIVYGGVNNGIERANIIMMPVLGISMLALAIYSLTLGGAKEGIAFLFYPDWSAFTKPSVYLAALGQAFFSLSLGMGALITYASYLDRKEKLPSAAGSVVLMDTSFAIVAGLMVFPAVFAFGLSPNGGPGLVFVVLPGIFDKLGILGVIIGFIFFILLFFAAISSSIAMLEVVVAYFISKFKMSRKLACVLIGSVIFLVGVPSSLGFGVWSDVNLIGDRSILDSIDFICSNILLPLGGLLIALFVGWTWDKKDIFLESDLGDTLVARTFRGVLIVIVPVAILMILLQILK